MAKAAKRSYQDEYLQILRDLDGDAAGRAAGEAYFASSLARGEERCAWASNPMILDAAQYDVLNGAAVTMGSIMEKVMAKYHRDRSFRKLLGLSPEVEDLTMVPSGCHAAVPLSRIDLLFDPATHDFTICGITTGGIDGMAMSAEVNRAVRSTNAFASFAKTHKSIETFDAMEAAVLSVLHTYGKWANAEEGRNHPTHPSLAVLDVKDSPRASENATVVEVMQGKGIYARTTTFETLRIAEVGGIRQLVDDRGPVTCVWLRATADEAVAVGGAGLEALREATRRGLVCTVGGYRSWPCCTRSFLQLLGSKECQQLLSRDERAFLAAHAPDVRVVVPSIDLSEFYDQQDWLLKTADGHWASDIVYGGDLSKAEWRKRLVKSIKRRDAIQRYLPQDTTPVVTPDGERDMIVMLGLYVFESKLCGIRAVAGEGATIAEWDPCYNLALMVVRD
jgi:hypothetical protein